MDKEMKDDLAYRTAEYWSNNCTDDDFYGNCMDTILGEVKDPDKAHEIWDIIEMKYLNL